MFCFNDIQAVVDFFLGSGYVVVRADCVWKPIGVIYFEMKMHRVIGVCNGVEYLSGICCHV